MVAPLLLPLGGRHEGGEGHGGQVEAVERPWQEGGGDPEGAGHQGRRGESQAFQFGFLQSFGFRPGRIKNLKKLENCFEQIVH